MWYELYTAEKLRELEEERLARRSRHPRLPRRPRRPPASSVLRRAGRALRRLGEGLDSWGAAPEGAADGESA
jgi:DNA-binding HxlR family transcriptional regulator